MAKVFMAFAFLLNCWVLQSMAGPVELEQSSKDDLSTSETFGYGYYQPRVYSTPLVAAGVPFGTAGAIAAPLAPAATIGSAAGAYARSGYGYGSDYGSGYGSGYKYGSGYDFGKRWGYGSGNGNAANQFYRHHPVYVAWG